MFNTKFFLLFFFLWIEVYTLVQGECYVFLRNMEANRPQLSQIIGSRTISLPLTPHSPPIKFQENERIRLYCATGFTGDETDNKFYDFVCDFDRMNPIFKTREHARYDMSPEEIRCKDLDWTMFESETAFDWCNPNENLGSLVMSIKNYNEKEKIAEICFDFAKMVPKIVSYISVENTDKLSFINNQFQNRTLKEEIVIKNYLNDYPVIITPEIIEWKELELFEYASLIPDMFPKFRDSENLSPIVWWRNLRVLNWNRFMNALHERSKTSAYKIYAGTGGVVRAPLKTKFETVTFTERRSLNPSNEKIPAYVWNVLYEINGTEEFVVIAYNSPYFEFFNSSEIIFCPDICEEIPWLKEVSYYFKYSFLGRIFCCSLNEAKQSGMLEGMLSVLSAKRESVDITSTSQHEFLETV